MNVVHRLYCRSNRWRAHLKDLLAWGCEDVDLADEHVLELGSGPGLSTEWVRSRLKAGQLSTIELDRADAAELAARLPDVDVHHADATALPFADGSFDVVVSFTMLHHVPTADAQQRLLAEAFRVLRPGGIFAGVDSKWGPLFAIGHLGDTLNLIPASDIAQRLRSARFVDVTSSEKRSAFRFRAVRP